MIRILIVDNTPLACSVTGYVLQADKDIEVVGHATNIEGALAQSQGGSCDAILVNAALPDNGALRLTRTIVRANLPVKVLITGLPDLAKAILRYIEAGAAGYVLREASVEELLRTIRAVHQNAALVSPHVAAALMSRVAELANVQANTTQAWTRQFTTLTQREREVLNLLRHGLSNQEIAASLTIETGTVKNHIHNILKKLNVSSRRDAVAHLTTLETITSSTQPALA
jgi:two-component system nitrate/nitrite response regulator NarL